MSERERHRLEQEEAAWAELIGAAVELLSKRKPLDTLAKVR